MKKCASAGKLTKEIRLNAICLITINLTKIGEWFLNEIIIG